MFFLYYNISKNSIVFIYVRKLQEKSLLITFDKTLKQNKNEKNFTIHDGDLYNVHHLKSNGCTKHRNN